MRSLRARSAAAPTYGELGIARAVAKALGQDEESWSVRDLLFLAYAFLMGVLGALVVTLLS